MKTLPVANLPICQRIFNSNVKILAPQKEIESLFKKNLPLFLFPPQTNLYFRA